MAKITEDTTLAKILKYPEAEKILAKYNLPCLDCPFAKMELAWPIAKLSFSMPGGFILSTIPGASNSCYDLLFPKFSKFSSLKDEENLVRISRTKPSRLSIKIFELFLS